MDEDEVRRRSNWQMFWSGAVAILAIILIALILIG